LGISEELDRTQAFDLGFRVRGLQPRFGCGHTAALCESMEQFLTDDAIVDWKHPQVLALAKSLGGSDGTVAVAARCFAWVRDEIRHSADQGDEVVTCAASDVLQYRTGLCYAKSHLLAALLRANGIPTGFCYQRLSVKYSGPPYCLHGLNAAFLPEIGWYRADARGNRPGLSTEFTPPIEMLAFQPNGVGEATFNTIWPEPLSVVVATLQEASTMTELLSNLPDWEADEP
jgi:transglutaminase-like putative cysteine protease